MRPEEYDIREIRCPKLGHPVKFSYCRVEAGVLPCTRSLTCWQSLIPVHGYFRSCLTPEQWTSSFDTIPKPKVVSLIELIEQARKRGCGQ